MRLDTPFVLGLATSASALWSITYYTTTDCSGAGKGVGVSKLGARLWTPTRNRSWSLQMMATTLP
jgi:hypothetical protein